MNSDEIGSVDWRSVAKLTLEGTFGCVALSLILNYLLFFSDVLSPFGRGVITAMVLPVVVAAPAFFLLGLERERTRRLRSDLARAATYDRATGCYRSAVFSSMIERRVQSRSRKGSRGAFLIVDAQNLGVITRRYGPEWEEEALRLVAAAIRSSLRSEDMIGRLGATEFGVFLQQATDEEAVEIGRRIQGAAAKVYFAPEGKADVIEVRIGGVTIESAQDFLEIFRSAQTQLLANRVGDVELKSSRQMQ